MIPTSALWDSSTTQRFYARFPLETPCQKTIYRRYSCLRDCRPCVLAPNTCSVAAATTIALPHFQARFPASVTPRVPAGIATVAVAARADGSDVEVACQFADLLAR